MPESRLDEILLGLRDAGLGSAGTDAIDAACRSRLDAEIARERRPRVRRSPRTTLVLPRLTGTAVVAGVLAVAACTYAVPATRAAVDDVYGALADWIAPGDHAAPGRAVNAGETLPDWVTAEDGEKRVLAEAAGEKLIAIRRGDRITFALNNYGQSGSVEDLRSYLEGKKLVVIGPGDWVADGRHDLRPLFGVTTASIERIRFDYADGGAPVTASGLSGAFAIVVESNRRPGSLTGYDQDGKPITRVDLMSSRADYRYCPGVGPVCKPWPK